KKVYDYGVGIGGPIMQDKLWFYTANRWWGSQSYAANNYFNKSTNPYVYVPDLTQPAFTKQRQVDNGVRLTWQTGKNKITGSTNFQEACACWLPIGAGALVSPEAAGASFQYGDPFMNLTQVSWSYPATNKLLFQAGASFLNQAVRFGSIRDVNGTWITPGPN